MATMAIKDVLATTSPHRYQTPPEQVATQEDHTTPCSTPSPAQYQSEYPLVSHLSHLLNAAVSCLNVYLSFEPLAHKVNAGTLQPHAGLINIYESGMLAQAGILHDLASNINTVLNHLLTTALHKKIESFGSYDSLLNAARFAPEVVADLPQQKLVKVGSAVTAVQDLPSIEFVARMHEGCDKLVTLCHGDAPQEIEGWKGCLKAVQEVLAQSQN